MTLPQLQRRDLELSLFCSILHLLLYEILLLQLGEEYVLPTSRLQLY